MTDATEYDDEGNAEIFTLPEQIEHGGGDPYVDVTQQVQMTLRYIEDRLKTLREEKERIRVEIKQLVSQQRILERMERIAAKDPDVGE